MANRHHNCAVFFIFFLFFVLIYQIIKILKNRLQERGKNRNVIFLMFILSLTFFYSKGIVNFENLEGKDVLVAYREGSANCMITLKLKSNQKFIERNICFGVERDKGVYEIVGDSIKMKYSTKNLEKDALAIVQLDTVAKHSKIGQLIFHRNLADEDPLIFEIKKYELIGIEQNHYETSF